MSTAQETFHLEATELLESLEGALLELERDPSDLEWVNAAFRALHTVKGSGAMAGQDQLAAFAHRLEAAFQPVRDGQTSLQPGLVDLALESVDVMRARLDAPEGAREDEASIISRLGQLSGEQAVPAAPVRSAGGEGGRFAVWLVVAPARSSDGTSRAAPLDDPAEALDVLRALGEIRVDVLDEVPDLEVLDPCAVYVGWDVTLTTEVSREVVEGALRTLPAAIRWQVEELGRPLAGASGPTAGASSSGGANATRSETVRVDAAKLDGLLDMIGELVIAQSRLSQLASHKRDATLESVAEEVERLVGDIREQSMGMRMQPIGSTFQRYVRLVRDLGRDLGKQVRLETFGGDVEVDRAILDGLGDSLVHLVRNSVDHGIESPAARTKSGKTEAGTVTLRAGHHDNRIVIEVSDDGRGLDLDAIEAKARARGLLEGPRPDDDALMEMIFEAGFSTAATVSEVSGRGVGMDAVRRNIERVGGRVRVESTKGEGSKFVVSLPLTLAIVEGLLCSVGETRYVLPLDAVEECVEGPSAASGDRRRRVIESRGETVPYVSLRDWFGEEGMAPSSQIVVASFNGRRFGFCVDVVIGQHQTVLKQLDPFSRVRGLAGATILGDGEVALVLDGEMIANAVVEEVVDASTAAPFHRSA